jgi:hypothetical protein
MSCWHGAQNAGKSIFKKAVWDNDKGEFCASKLDRYKSRFGMFDDGTECTKCFTKCHLKSLMQSYSFA